MDSPKSSHMHIKSTLHTGLTPGPFVISTTSELNQSCTSVDALCSPSTTHSFLSGSTSSHRSQSRSWGDLSGSQNEGNYPGYFAPKSPMSDEDDDSSEYLDRFGSKLEKIIESQNSSSETSKEKNIIDKYFNRIKQQVNLSFNEKQSEESSHDVELGLLSSNCGRNEKSRYSVPDIKVNYTTSLQKRSCSVTHLEKQNVGKPYTISDTIQESSVFVNNAYEASQGSNDLDKPFSSKACQKSLERTARSLCLPIGLTLPATQDTSNENLGSDIKKSNVNDSLSSIDNSSYIEYLQNKENQLNEDNVNGDDNVSGPKDNKNLVKVFYEKYQYYPRRESCPIKNTKLRSDLLFRGMQLNQEACKRRFSEHKTDCISSKESLPQKPCNSKAQGTCLSAKHGGAMSAGDVRPRQNSLLCPTSLLAVPGRAVLERESKSRKSSFLSAVNGTLYDKISLASFRSSILDEDKSLSKSEEARTKIIKNINTVSIYLFIRLFLNHIKSVFLLDLYI